MGIRQFYAFFAAQLKLLKNQLIAFSFLSVILVIGFSLLAVKGNFSISEFFESFGLIVWIMIGLIGSNITARTVTEDFSDRHGLIILTQPVDRKIIIISRITACFISILLPIIIIYTAGLISGLIIYETFMHNLLLSFSFSLLYSFAFISFVAGIGAVSRDKNTALSAGLTVSLLAVFVLAVFGKLLGIEPWFFLPYGGLAISSVVTLPQLPHINTGNFFFYYIPYPLEAVLIMLVYTAVFLSISILSYSRKEIID